MKKLAVGILAHVDAGKTTLTEAMLYTCGSIRTLGRVDHKNSLLDNHELERKRGITIFSKQARLKTSKMELCLIDTPGHVDFSAETERSLSVIDYAILVISGTDGVQAHTETLWQLLSSYSVPTVIFVTKMDIPTADRAEVFDDLCRHLSENCVDFSLAHDEVFFESLAMCSDAALESFMEKGSLSDSEVGRLIAKRRVFPVLFGSGLKLEGVKELIELLETYAPAPEYGKDFSAKVYKILRDNQESRLSLMKITGGTLSCRDTICGEKVTEIRLYSGAKFETTDKAQSGEVCAVKGLTKTYPGQSIGGDSCDVTPVLEPVLSYRVVLPKGMDEHTALNRLKQLEDEDPTLHIRWNEQIREIRIELMGKVQTEVLTALIKERFDMDVTIDSGGIMYRETVKAPVCGAGHYEPLRHYAEAHVLIEPLPEGSGVIYDTACPDEMLSREWQNHVLGQLASKKHLGVLTGSPLTDVKITLTAGRAHLKHTEGGDFREASHRAVRQALMKAESVLLEPWYEFRIELPPEHIGRAISDIRAKNGEFQTEGGDTITGLVPVSEMSDYASVLAAYSSGRGRMSLRPAGYKPCHNTDEVLSGISYDPEADLLNSPDSVFCSHGAATLIKWNEADENMHVSPEREKDTEKTEPQLKRGMSIDDKELEAIMEREFGPVRRRMYTKPEVSLPADEVFIEPSKQEYLIIDGYNLIFADEKLKELAEKSLELARTRLLDTLKSYRAFRGCELVLVFDGYKVEGNPGEKELDGVKTVYTRENETADMYIEKLANDIGKNYSVKVVTNDSLIRLSALRSGVLRMSSSEFINELEYVKKRISEYTDGKR